MRTRTKGITVAANGERTVNKEHRGTRIFRRLGQCNQADAEAWLTQRQNEIDTRAEAARRRGTRHLFADGAAQYLIELRRRNGDAAGLIAYHLSLVLPFIGELTLEAVHGATLQSFIDDRLEPDKKGRVVKRVTVNRTLEVVRTVLNRAARVWRNSDGSPWLGAAPLIEMLEESDSRKPYPISWAEQRTLFKELAPHLLIMAEFDVNTGLREDNVCGLRWSWERPVQGLKRSVFIIPPEFYKGGKRSHVVILNDAAWKIVEQQRGQHAEFVFPFGTDSDGQATRLDAMNNSGWQAARRRAGLELVRVHDLRHTYAQRLRQVGVSKEDRAVLLGHASSDMPEHYATPTVHRLVQQANQVRFARDETTVLRLVAG